MQMIQREVEVRTGGQGLIEVTDQMAEFVCEAAIRTGLCQLFCSHTSCSLVLMENADPTARADLEGWLDRLVDPDDPEFTHTLEGPDDMPSHIKMALTRSSEIIPIRDGRLALGTWQGVFLWEHRSRPHRRRLVLSAWG
jgi:secondary thiamine-phosphate synthase enzyme